MTNTRTTRREYVFTEVAKADYEYLRDQYEEEFGKEPSEKWETDLLTELAGYTFSELIGRVVYHDGLPKSAYSKVTDRVVALERRGGRTPTGPKENPEVVIFELPKA